MWKIAPPFNIKNDEKSIILRTSPYLETVSGDLIKKKKVNYYT